ncbi:MAG: NTP transferase domain-containing protein [Bacteroidales bacterium]|nr:NTP transferase domain-containing protein [Bacteroidales bacterium]
MKIIIPMAGMGTRMRPHTLTVPKPLVKLAGKTIVQRLVEGIADVCDEKIDEIGFVIGNFGKKVEEDLCKIAEGVGAKAKIYYQHEALGTAHAIWCAADSLDDKVVVAFADTLFFADFKISADADSIIWVQKVANPEAYGVVTTNAQGIISGFVEKPKQFVSDLAIIGIYYFKSGETLRSEIQYLIDNDVRQSGEFQLTTALENMRAKGLAFEPRQVDEWLDCGNKNITVATHQRVLARDNSSATISPKAVIENASVIPPCHIEEGAEIRNSVVGPYVSVGRNTKICCSIVNNSVIQEDTEIENLNIHNSMIGSHAKLKGSALDLSVGDYNNIEVK